MSIVAVVGLPCQQVAFGCVATKSETGEEADVSSMDWYREQVRPREANKKISNQRSLTSNLIG